MINSQVIHSILQVLVHPLVLQIQLFLWDHVFLVFLVDLHLLAPLSDPSHL